MGTTAARAPDAGLTSAEVDARRLDGRANQVPATTSRPLSAIIRTNVLTRFNAILGALLGVIVVVGPFQDALFGVVLVVNTLIGIAQEVRAKITLDRLALLSAPRARVRRDGVVAEAALDELVLDDVIELRRGDQVPLDGTVLDGDLEMDESLLTGEADPVARPPGAEIRSGSFVTSGSGAFRVDRVGADSYAQQIAGAARRFALTRSELTDGINRILRLVQWVILPVATLLVVSQLLSNESLPDAIRGSVAGVGALIPEGLVLLTSVAFAIAVARLGRRRVLVQELPAVEGLARVDVLCLDKTGTLTVGGIEAEGFDELDTAGQRVDEVLGAIAAVEAHPNATLAAIAARWGRPGGWTPVASVPFSSARRWSAADFGERGTWVLGAPDALVPNGAVAISRRLADATAAGRRVLLLAATSSTLAAGDPALPAPLRPVALVRLVERIRDDARNTLAFFGREGVEIKVMSGDHPDTVGAIAGSVGVPGADRPVDAATMSDDELRELVGSRSVFGRVAPHQKRVMVAALQAQGRTVAMTGDGVNDVLALKDADVGIAMGSGSAAARGVAQLVLLDDAFAALPTVIAEGRRVIANIERTANLFLNKTAYATLIAVVVGVTGVAYPLLPRHLTVVDYFSIGLPAFVLALLPNTRRFRPGFVDRVLRFAIPCGAVSGAAALGAYFVDRQAGLAVDVGRTTTTIVLVALGLWVVALLSRPFNAVKWSLVAVLSGCFVGMLLAPAARRYFALRVPPATQLAVALVITAVACAALEVLYRVLRAPTGLVET